VRPFGDALRRLACGSPAIKRVAVKVTANSTRLNRIDRSFDLTKHFRMTNESSNMFFAQNPDLKHQDLGLIVNS
jgi:hypothetical protein